MAKDGKLNYNAIDKFISKSKEFSDISCWQAIIDKEKPKNDSTSIRQIYSVKSKTIKTFQKDAEKPKSQFAIIRTTYLGGDSSISGDYGIDDFNFSIYSLVEIFSENDKLSLGFINKVFFVWENHQSSEFPDIEDVIAIKTDTNEYCFGLISGIGRFSSECIGKKATFFMKYKNQFQKIFEYPYSFETIANKVIGFNADFALVKDKEQFLFMINNKWYTRKSEKTKTIKKLKAEKITVSIDVTEEYDYWQYINEFIEKYL